MIQRFLSPLHLLVFYRCFNPCCIVIYRSFTVWHPNVSSVTGAICLDILKDQWSPALTMKTAMLSLQALMCSPEPNDPQDAVVATMYKERQAEFQSTARYNMLKCISMCVFRCVR